MTAEGSLLLTTSLVFVAQVVVSRAIIFDNMVDALLFSGYFAVGVLALGALLLLIFP